MAKKKATALPAEQIQQSIFLVRGERVMLDSDIASIYKVETGALNRAVKRNEARFPERFMFRLSPEEWENLKCQFGITSSWGGRRHPPNVFTEHGAVMLASVLNSPEAITASIHVVEAFVRMREMINTVESLSHKLETLERKMVEHDKSFATVFEAIRQLMVPPVDKPKGRIGFKSKSSHKP